MKKSLGLLSAFFVIMLLPSNSFAKVQEVKFTCASVLKKVQAAGNRSVAENQRYATPHVEADSFRVSETFRGWVMRKLQLLNEEPYPFVEKNETPLALAWARNVFGRLPADQAGLLKMEAIEKDLSETLAAITAYPTQMRSLIDQAANLEVEQKALNQALGRWLPWPRKSMIDMNAPSPIRVEIPYFVNGVLNAEPRVEYYGSVSQLLIAAKKETSRDLEKISQDIRKLGLAQAEKTQKLEVYVHEFRRELSLDPSFDKAKIDPKYALLIHEIGKLYVSGEVDGILRPEVAPPYQAWSRWRWKAFFRQVSMIWWKKKVGQQTIAGEQRFVGEDLWKFIESLTAEEKRAIGMGNIAPGFQLLTGSKWMRWVGVMKQAFDQSKWKRIIITTAVPLVTGAAAGLEKKDEYGQPWLVGVAKEFMADFFERDKCVHTESENDFKNCVANYLRTRFPKQYLYQLMDWDSLVAGGQIRDPKILEAIEEIKSERRIYQQSKKTESLLTNALNSALEDPNDVTSDLYRKNLVKSQDDGFMLMKLLSPTPGIGYLATLFPFAYQIPKLRALARVAVENREDATIRKECLAKMREEPFGAELATEIEKFLTDRAAYLTTRTNLEGIDKMINEAIKVDRGTADSNP